MVSLLFSCADNTSQSTAATANPFDLSEVKNSIEAVNKQFGDAALKGDSATVVSLYHSEALIADIFFDWDLY